MANVKVISFPQAEGDVNSLKQTFQLCSHSGLHEE